MKPDLEYHDELLRFFYSANMVSMICSLSRPGYAGSYALFQAAGAGTSDLGNGYHAISRL